MTTFLFHPLTRHRQNKKKILMGYITLNVPSSDCHILFPNNDSYDFIKQSLVHSPYHVNLSVKDSIGAGFAAQDGHTNIQGKETT